MTVDPEAEICVTCGATEAMIASMLGVLDPGDEVVVFEPFYEIKVHLSVYWRKVVDDRSEAY